MGSFISVNAQVSDTVNVIIPRIFDSLAKSILTTVPILTDTGSINYLIIKARDYKMPYHRIY